MTDLPAPIDLVELRRLYANRFSDEGETAFYTACVKYFPALLALAEEVERAKALVTDLEPAPRRASYDTAEWS